MSPIRARTRSHAPRRARSRRGLTIIEVVVAISMLAGVGSILFGTIAFTERAAAHDQHRLNAMEVAHRVVVQWIDDPDWIRRQPKRTAYDEHMYVFEVEELFLIEDEDDVRTLSVSNARAIPAEQLKGMGREGTDKIVKSAMRVLNVRVWYEDEEGAVDPEPLVHVTRTYWLTATDRGLAELMALLFETMNGSGDE